MKISYIVPVYNGQAFIHRCLDSILSQRFDSVEVVFVDDGSTDGTPKILRRLASKYANCRAYFQPNLGCSAARNKAILEAEGEFLAILDVDDVAIGERSRSQYEKALEEKADLVVGGSRIVDIHRNKIGVYFPPTMPSAMYQRLLRRKASFHHSSCLMRTAKVVSLGGYCERFRQGEDLDIMYRLFETGRIAAVNDLVVEHTRHDNSLSNGSNAEESLFFGVFVTACHLMRSKTNLDIRSLENPEYRNILKLSREWFNGGSTIEEFRFRQELKESRRLGAYELLRKALLNPLPSALCGLMKVRGDQSPQNLAAYLMQSDVLINCLRA